MPPLKNKKWGKKKVKNKQTNLLIEKINVEGKVVELNCAIGKLHVKLVDINFSQQKLSQFLFE